MKTFLLAMVRIYQLFLSPLLGGHCRFFPTCSNYAREALASRSLGKALVLIFLRLLKCHPFHPGGHDPLGPLR